jgi:Protein of unknown function (DUF669)
MALLNFDASQVAPEQSNITPVPAGIYVAQVIDSDVKPLKSGNGDALNLTLRILEGAHVNRQVWASLNIRHSNPQAQGIAQAQLSALCHAVGVIKVNGDSTVLHNRPLRIRVKVREADGQYPARNEVNGFEALPGGAAPPMGQAPVFAAPPQAAPAAPGWATPAQAAPASSTAPWARA